jgi:antitoxin HicB
MKRLKYHVMLRWGPEDEVYTAWVPALPGCVTFGGTIEEALKMVRDAIVGYVKTLEAHGEEIPTDEDVLERTIDIEAHA